MIIDEIRKTETNTELVPHFKNRHFTYIDFVMNTKSKEKRVLQKLHLKKFVLRQNSNKSF